MANSRLRLRFRGSVCVSLCDNAILLSAQCDYHALFPGEHQDPEGPEVAVKFSAGEQVLLSPFSGQGNGSRPTVKDRGAVGSALEKKTRFIK